MNNTEKLKELNSTEKDLSWRLDHVYYIGYTFALMLAGLALISGLVTLASIPMGVKIALWSLAGANTIGSLAVAGKATSNIVRANKTLSKIAEEKEQIKESEKAKEVSKTEEKAPAKKVAKKAPIQTEVVDEVERERE